MSRNLFPALAVLLVTFFFAASCFSQQTSQMPSAPMRLASLRINDALQWQRTSPDAKNVNGPVLYQIIFKSSAAPGKIPVVTNQHTLADSPLSVITTMSGGAIEFPDTTTQATAGFTFTGFGLLPSLDSTTKANGVFVDTTKIQQRINGACATQAAMVAVDQAGNPICAFVVTDVNSGFGLTQGGPISGIVPISVDPTAIQQRVSGTCSAGDVISAVNQDGTVTCQAAFDGNRIRTARANFTQTLSTEEVAVNWGTAFADANYTASCSIAEATGRTMLVYGINSISASGMVVAVSGGGPGDAGVMHCIAVHD